MKAARIYCVAILCLVIFGLAFSEQRNLATPLSRLWGHWQEPSGQHWYFSKVTKTGEEASLIKVNPDKQTLLKYINKLLLAGKMSQSEAIEARKVIDEEAGKATYLKYQLITQEPGEARIIIATDEKVPSMILSPGEEPPYIKYEFHVDKDGKQMRFIALTFIKNRSELKDLVIFRFIDTKTTPEE